MPTTRIACWMLLTCLVAAKVDAADLAGVVLDPAGQPVAHARVDIATAAPKVGRGIFCPSCYLDCAKRTTTDQLGRFEIKDVSDELRFRVLCTAAGMHAHLTDLVDPASDPLLMVLERVPAGFPPEQMIRGLVVGEQGQPIEGALVSPKGAKTAERRWWGRVDGARPAVSDADGRFVMYLADNLLAVDLEIEADGFAGTTTELIEAGGNESRIVVPVGAQVAGTLTLAGAPAPNVRIAVVQTDRSATTHFIQAVQGTTDLDGRFVIENLPAAQEYVIFSPVGGSTGGPILTTKRFRVPESGSSRDLATLSLRAGVTLAGRIEPPAGQPLPPDIKLSLGRDPAWDLIEVKVDEDGHFAIGDLPPETYKVRFVAQAWVLDPGRLKHQQLEPNAFGVRLDDSLSGLVVPVWPEGSASPPADSGQTLPTTPEGVERDESESAATAAAEVDFTTFDPLPIERTKEPCPPDGPAIQVRGHVASIDGTPIRGAEVVLRAKLGGRQYVVGVAHSRDVLARNTTDAAGRFAFDNVLIPLRLEDVITDLGQVRPAAELLVVAEGFGMASADVSALSNEGVVSIRLAPAADVRGVIRTPDVEPLPDATVRVWAVTESSLTFAPVFNAPGDVNLARSEFSLAAVTGADGRFELEHAPPDRRICVEVTAPGFSREVLFVDTDDRGTITEMTSKGIRSRVTHPVVHSPLEVELAKTFNTRFTVVDGEGNRVRDGGIQLIDAERHYAGSGQLGAVGVAYMHLEQPGQYRFIYSSDPLEPRIGYSATFDVPELDEIVDIEVQLPQHQWLTGRVVDSDTGTGVAGAYVGFSQPGAAEGDRPHGSGMAVSETDGAFRLPVVPGSGRVTIVRPVHGYFPDTYANRRSREPQAAGIVVEIPESGEVAPVELPISRGIVIRGVVHDSEGEPLADARVLAQNIDSPYRRASATTRADGRFEIGGLSPHVATVLSIAGPTGGVLQTIAGEPDHPWEVTRAVELDLDAERGVTLAGRVFDNGSPRRDVRMVLQRFLPGEEGRIIAFAEVRTDAAGRYAVAGLSPGDRYRFEVQTADGSTDPAWRHQSPSVQTIPENAQGVVDVPDVNLVRPGQSIAGMVVDPAGNPVLGVRVSVGVAFGRTSDRMETGDDGRFRLENLPHLPLEILVYQPNPQGGRILYPARMRPQINQTDIQIVYDPMLRTEIEDLDQP